MPQHRPDISLHSSNHNRYPLVKDIQTNRLFCGGIDLLVWLF